MLVWQDIGVIHRLSRASKRVDLLYTWPHVEADSLERIEIPRDKYPEHANKMLVQSIRAHENLYHGTFLLPKHFRSRKEVAILDWLYNISKNPPNSFRGPSMREQIMRDESSTVNGC